MPMIDTAEIVTKRYNISREKQDEYGLESAHRGRAAGQVRDELAPITMMAVTKKATGAVTMKEVTLSQDDPRPETTAEGLASSGGARRGFTMPPAMPASCRTRQRLGDHERQEAASAGCSRSASSAASCPPAASG